MLKTKEQQLNDLSYQEEHVSCLNYMQKEHAGFRRVIMRAGEDVHETKHAYNLLIFVLSGRIRLNCKDAFGKAVCADQMILIPQSSAFDWFADEDSECIFFQFNAPASNCDKMIFESLHPICEKQGYDFVPSLIKESLRKYLDLLVFYLQNKVSCVHFHEIKHRELFLCLRVFYTRAEIAHLFHPLIGRTPSFRDFVLRNYDPLMTVNDLIERSNMGKTRFHETFKKEFGNTAKSWLLHEKINDIRYEALRPGISVKELMMKFGFDTSSSFVQFCRNHFGCTPSQLINTVQAK